MARETKDIYELGEIPPEFHVPKMMHALGNSPGAPRSTVNGDAA